ncbi:hypothetical protein KORDIASMS9_02412 [Kordia sp. SMS9]|uniref:hypothetical protein n=1 Tax=Kordia sp. SMS9 TaxID=2282170 RepID=UPI000E0D7ACB|nr:hypothetical protein [Kordia sp. SMS9]AXG70173.1 hypothetical protein KORDIASMS9_02412 [Kordia sp. SMS9]
MKILTIVTSIVAVFFMTTYQNTTVEATYDGYEDGVYYFTDGNDETLEFQEVDKEVLKAYDLMSKKFENRSFNVTYKTVEEEDEEGDSYTMYVITALKLIE